MKPNFVIPVFGLLLASACASRNEKMIIRPEPPEQETAVELFRIIEFQNEAAGETLPEWTACYLRGGIPEIEALDRYQNKYVFIGKNQGTNFTALNQWAENFTVIQDFPALAALRIESRLIGAASLYPDDEYGDYFEALIKKAYDAEYFGTQKEASFWIKKSLEKKIDSEEAPEDELAVEEVYEFFVLISIDKPVLQNRIRELMAAVNPDVPPTRAQNAAIHRIQQNFFEGF
jgi:hypothetical protein